ncbi:MAG: hypothetical protein NVSMB65_02930 [Chloroflexota bacterium]
MALPWRSPVLTPTIVPVSSAPCWALSVFYAHHTVVARSRQSSDSLDKQAQAGGLIAPAGVLTASRDPVEERGRCAYV